MRILSGDFAHFCMSSCRDTLPQYLKFRSVCNQKRDVHLDFTRNISICFGFNHLLNIICRQPIRNGSQNNYCTFFPFCRYEENRTQIKINGRINMAALYVIIIIKTASTLDILQTPTIHSWIHLFK